MNEYIRSQFSNLYNVEFNYDDGKKLRIFYTKKDYIQISLDKYITDDLINLAIKRLKPRIIGVCKLCKWIKEETRLSERIQKILNDYFKFDIKFSIVLKNNILHITYMDKEEILDIGNFPDIIIHQPILNFFIGIAGQNSTMKSIEKKLPQIFFNNTDSIKKHYLKEISENEDFISFKLTVEKTLNEYKEMVINLGRTRIRFSFNGTLIPLISNPHFLTNPEEYNIEFIQNNIVFSTKTKPENWIFTKGKELNFVFDIASLKDFYNKCIFINRIYYDLFEIMRKSEYSPKNISIYIDDKNQFFIMDYSDILKINDYNEVYSFVINTKNKIDSSLQITDKELLKRHAILNSSNANILFKSMKMFKKVTYNTYLALCTAQGISKNDASSYYESIEKTLPKLQELGILITYSIKNINEYILEFSEDSMNLFLIDCMELRNNISENLSEISFKEAINCLSVIDICKIFNNEDIIKKYTLEIIESLGNTYYCENFKEVFIQCIPMIDTKYLPILKFKISRIDAKKRMGSLYSFIEKFVNKGVLAYHGEF